MEKLSILTELLQRQLAGEEAVTQEQAVEWLKLYPYFSLPLMLYLHQGGKNDTHAIHLASAYTSDLSHLATSIGRYENYADLYPPEQELQANNTDDAIELFLRTYGNGECATEDWLPTEASEGKIPVVETTESSPDELTGTQENGTEYPDIIPVYDYMSTVESMPDVENAAPLQGEELLSRFIEAEEAGEELFSKPAIPTSLSHTAPQSTAPVHAAEDKEPLFTESLAKIYIRQRRYAKALEIIRKLSLNNPEKNVYFADQIRFLEKLIINIKN